MQFCGPSQNPNLPKMTARWNQIKFQEETFTLKLNHQHPVSCTTQGREILRNTNSRVENYQYVQLTLIKNFDVNDFVVPVIPVN